METHGDTQRHTETHIHREMERERERKKNLFFTILLTFWEKRRSIEHRFVHINLWYLFSVRFPPPICSLCKK